MPGYLRDDRERAIPVSEPRQALTRTTLTALLADSEIEKLCQGLAMASGFPCRWW